MVLISFSKNGPGPFFPFFLEFQPGRATATNVAVRKQVEAVAADAIVDVYVKINNMAFYYMQVY